MKVTNMGPTTMGNPFLMVVITSPANQAKLERYRQVNLQISDSRGPDGGAGERRSLRRGRCFASSR